VGLGNRVNWPTSAQTPAADSVSIPRKQRSLAITVACELAGTASSSVETSVDRRPISSSTDAR